MRKLSWLFFAITMACSTHTKIVDEADQKPKDTNTLKLVHFRGPLWISEDHFYDGENSIVYIGDQYVTVIGATWTPETAKLLVAEIKKVTDKLHSQRKTRVAGRRQCSGVSEDLEKVEGTSSGHRSTGPS